MTSLPHRYHVRLDAGATGLARVTADTMPVFEAAPPVEFDGPGGAWTPEHLLLAAVETCFVFTFRAIAKHARLDFRELDVVAEGVVDRDDGRLRFVEIVLRVRIALAAGTNRKRVLEVIDKSERRCIVAASLATPVRVVPRVEAHDDAEAAAA